MAQGAALGRDLGTTEGASKASDSDVAIGTGVAGTRATTVGGRHRLRTANSSTRLSATTESDGLPSDLEDPVLEQDEPLRKSCKVRISAGKVCLFSPSHWAN